ncbi:hypothetical protein BWQ96_06609 [Gracilariopsis chorda]|uniref:T6SS Phospholipase effector Tle1-like catalytic domain-containing protein n=1 Tax=Gracilariopsis chorda TaxID=448386 RepID=A0A2V3IR68_9FLOR|nr:hypothetical protein BWQ96_06609 [Gracilariopsis chorda]|eukprot:PXF43650.1 hypothetical protein BWQ96_06609 [Gracilariopsis chorda]
MIGPTRPSKRICVFSDGTWNTPELDTLTNIAILARALQYKSADGIPQIAFYDPGVGSEGGVVDRLRGGAFGAGIDLNIQQLYTFLAMNYDEGDEIYMFGYSRGAYTVRSLAGMVHEAGLVYRDKLDFVQDAYNLYRTNHDPESVEAKNFRAANSRRVPVKLLTCFDTVGALGIPDGLPFPLSLLEDNNRYRFHDTQLSDLIENAIHALSIDEDRRAFYPTFMKAHSARGPKQLTQKFLPGSHGGVGGGSEILKPFSQNALKFVLDDIRTRGLGIEFDAEQLPKSFDYNTPVLPPRGLFNRHNFIKAVTGSQIREIRAVEELHATAVIRYHRTPKWRPEALKPLKDKILEFAAKLKDIIEDGAAETIEHVHNIANTLNGALS